MQANKGVFALLLGSGISRPAQIPSGWDVVLDLIRRVAVAQGDDCGSDPAKWYQERFNCDPTYSALLEKAATTPALRRGLLHPLFVPADDDERARGIKMPTSAHKAIADLARGGYIRIILTTNFDNLIELALEEKGVQPTVIASVEAAAGAMPLDPSMCYVVKIHGDFRDARIRNTADELERYEPPLARLLNRVLNEHGLIICGWSGESDTALRGTLSRIATHRYPTYWIARSAPSGLGNDLIRQRKADVISAVTADEFFTQLAERVASLEAITKPHPLSVAMAVETVKRYVETDQTMRLTDLMQDTAGNLVASLSGEEFATTNEGVSRKGDTIPKRIARYDAICEPLVQMMATGVYWGSESANALWLRIVQRIANTADRRNGLADFIRLARYPATLVFYACGISSVDTGKLAVLQLLTSQLRLPYLGTSSYDMPAVALSPHVSVNADAARALPDAGRYTPANSHVFAILRPQFRSLIPEDERFNIAFDRFEAFAALVSIDMALERDDELPLPYGRFVWHGHPDFVSYPSDRFNILEDLKAEADEAGDGWMPLRNGLFRGLFVRFEMAYTYLLEQVNAQRDRLRWR